MKLLELAQAIVDSGFAEFVGDGITIEYNPRPILIAIFADIGAMPKYVNSYDNSKWRALCIVGKPNKPQPRPLYHASDCTIEESGQPGSLERINALSDYYWHKNRMTIDAHNGAVNVENEISPFAISDDTIADNLASLMLAQSKRLADNSLPCLELPPAIDFGDKRRRASTINHNSE